MSKERSNNFSREELNKLKELLEKYSVIMNKKTDHASTKQKDEAWCQLTDEFNSNNLIYRTKKQLIYKFNNMKKNARNVLYKLSSKELSQEKKERRCTGGGPPPPKPSDTSEWLCSIMGESIVGLPSTHDSDFILDNTSQLKGEEAQQSVALPNIEEEMSTIESYTDGHNDGVISDAPQIVQILDVQDNEETQETDKFDTSTPFAMLRKPVSKRLEPTNRKRKLIFTPLETRKKIVAVANEKELYIKKKGVRDQQLLEFAEEKHRKNMQLHELELGFKKKLHELLLKKAAIEVEIEEEKLKKIKSGK